VDTQKTKYLYGYVFVAFFDSGRHYRSNWKALKILRLSSQLWRIDGTADRKEIC
jgi:hypothetical protein